MSEALDLAIVAAWNRGDLEEHARLTAVAARVARRRADDRRRARAALDRFIADLYGEFMTTHEE